ncbi:MAG: enoyl-CoA hydratase/isomerase family protein [Bacteroidales bacterium]|nr:enoyl-CoA hydratase/isomerase family protein [Bacteroidales bacterium]
MQYIKYEHKNRIVYITLNRPEKRNALNEKLVNELKQSIKLAEDDANIKVIVLKAEGKAFCAGADLGYLQKLQNFSYEENLQDSNNLMELYKMIYTSEKIFIAQVEGHAIAGGAGLATVCDFIFSVPEAKYGYTEVNIGFVPAIVSVFLIRKIGEAKSKELLLTGKIISAQEAADMNIFNFIEEKKEIQNAVDKFAQNLIDKTSADSLRITKQLIAKIQSFGYEEALNLAAEANAKSRETDDCKKGIDAFLLKKEINW